MVQTARRSAAISQAKLELAKLLLSGASDLDATRVPRNCAATPNSPATATLAALIFPRGEKVEADAEQGARAAGGGGRGGRRRSRGTARPTLHRATAAGRATMRARRRCCWRSPPRRAAPAGDFGLGDIYFRGHGRRGRPGRARRTITRGPPRKDHVRAKTALATILYDGLGRPMDRARGAKLFFEAAEAGELVAQYRAGMICMTGEGAPRDLDRAETYLRAAGKKGHTGAMMALGEFYSRGDGREPNLREAETWYRLAADAGDVHALFIAGRFAATGDGSYQEPARRGAAISARRPRAGHVIAAFNIAAFYASGTGVEARPGAGARVVSRRPPSRTCRSRRCGSRACCCPAKAASATPPRRANGWSAPPRRTIPRPRRCSPPCSCSADKTTRDVRKAETLLREAATSGFSVAAMQLGHLYAGRYDVAARPEDAVRWYTIAAEAGQAEAQYILGVMYRHGRVVAQDPAAAAGWFARAAESGMTAAQFDLGVMYCTGEGVDARRRARRGDVSPGGRGRPRRRHAQLGRDAVQGHRRRGRRGGRAGVDREGQARRARRPPRRRSAPERPARDGRTRPISAPSISPQARRLLEPICSTPLSIAARRGCDPTTTPSRITFARARSAGLRPNPVFDPALVSRRATPTPSADVDPLLHYAVDRRARQGATPRRCSTSRWYRARLRRRAAARALSRASLRPVQPGPRIRRRVLSARPIPTSARRGWTRSCITCISAFASSASRAPASTRGFTRCAISVTTAAPTPSPICARTPTLGAAPRANRPLYDASDAFGAPGSALSSARAPPAAGDAAGARARLSSDAVSPHPRE